MAAYITAPAIPELKVTHTPRQSHPILGGIRHVFEFGNGYGASVVQHDYSYGRELGLWQFGVVADLTMENGILCGDLLYDTPITENPVGNLTAAGVQSLLDQVAGLPPIAGAAGKN